MRVLITNNRLDTRGGSEAFVRDLARGLQRRGHSVMAYSSDLGQRERLLDKDVMPVSTDLEDLPVVPDIIHAQHHLDAMTALNALPGVPAVYQCHGAGWREWAPRHPRIYRYVAVSATAAERLTVESNIPPSNISVLLNGIDLARFSRVRTLPSRPARALFFNSRHDQDSAAVAAIREAAARCGVTLDFAGERVGPRLDQPEFVLPDYDVVFASGLAAMEALACGCAVIILGRTSCGDLVRMDNVERLRCANFSIAVNSSPPSSDHVTRELDRFSAADAEQVSAWVRQHVDFDRCVDALLGFYDEAIERHQAVAPNLREEVLAASRYLRHIVPLIKMTDTMLGEQWAWPARADTFEDLRAQVVRLQQRIDRAQSSR